MCLVPNYSFTVLVRSVIKEKTTTKARCNEMTRWCNTLAIIKKSLQCLSLMSINEIIIAICIFNLKRKVLMPLKERRNLQQTKRQ